MGYNSMTQSLSIILIGRAYFVTVLLRVMELQPNLVV